MEQALLVFHMLVESIWTQKCKEEEFTTVLQQAAQLKAMLWSADLMQVEEEQRIRFFLDVKRIELVARQVLSPDVIREMNGETRTYYGYLYTFLCQHSNDLLMIYNEFPFQIPIHIACGNCGNDIHSVLVNPAEFNEKNGTTVIDTGYEREEDGLNPFNEDPIFEAETPEGFGEKDCNEWDFFTNTMRFLDMCGEEYLMGILKYLYGQHTCTKCHFTEQVITSYRKWFYVNQPNYNEPKEELVTWLEEKAKEASGEGQGEIASFFYRMAAWYEMSRGEADWKKIYGDILSYYEECKEEEYFYTRQVQYILRKLLETDFEEEKARAYNQVAVGCGFERSEEEKNRWNLTWQAYLKAVSIYHKNQMQDDKGYWNALKGLCLTVADGEKGNIDLADELLLDYIAKLEARGSEKEQIGEAYRNLARMWAEGAGDYEKCYAYFETYLEIAKDVHGEDKSFLAELYEELADYYEADGNIKKACELRELAVEIHVREGESVSVAEACLALGKSYYHLGMSDQAMVCLKKAESLYKKGVKGKIPNGKMAEVHLFKGNIYMDEEKIKQAGKEYREATAICNQLMEIGNNTEEIEACREILADIQNEMENQE